MNPETWISDWITLVPLNVRKGWLDFWSLREKITSWVCLLISVLKLIYHWKAQLLIFSKSSFKLIPDWFISCTTEISEVSSGNSLGFEPKLLDKSLIWIKKKSGPGMDPSGTPVNELKWFAIIPYHTWVNTIF